MLEDTNSLDGAHIMSSWLVVVVCSALTSLSTIFQRTGSHGLDPGPQHTKVVKNGNSCSSLGTQTYEVESTQCRDNVTGCGIMSNVWGMLLQWGRHRRDMTEKLLKATLNRTNKNNNNFQSYHDGVWLLYNTSTMLTVIVLPHWSIMPQILDMIPPHPVTLSWHWVDQS